MNPSGAPDPLYILARRVLLDALEALGAQRHAAILVGAQAVYLHTGPAGLAVPEYTTDADIALNPEFLADTPRLEEIMKGAKFEPDGSNVGSWVTKRLQKGREVDVKVDLLIPSAIGGKGRRGARLGVHGNKAARKVKGLEAALVDQNPMAIASLKPAADPRNFKIAVAGPAALLIAKLHKLADRQEDAGRLNDKDALDALRLLRSTNTEKLARVFEDLLKDKIAGGVTRDAIKLLENLFAKPESPGSRMAAQAVTPLEPPDTTAASCSALATDLLRVLK
ncbi:GSU2403 family nucleotidyltransferase fold protein [Elusimicrobiota bacterium]